MKATGSIPLFAIALSSSIGCVSDGLPKQELRHDGGNAHEAAQERAGAADPRGLDARARRSEASRATIGSHDARTTDHVAADTTTSGRVPPRRSTRETGIAIGDTGHPGDETSQLHKDASAAKPVDGKNPVDGPSVRVHEASSRRQPDAGDPRRDASVTNDGSLSHRDATADEVRPPGSGDTGGAGSLWSTASLPAFDAATTTHVRTVLADGARRGNSRNVFARCGDSITASANFLFAIGLGSYELGSFGALEPTIAAYRATVLPDGTDSFTRVTQCAVGGWTTSNALAPPVAIVTELDALSPAILFELFGTNDSQHLSLDQFRTNMNQIVDVAETRGVVLVLSTAPPRTDYANADRDVAAFNTVIEQTAASRCLPMIDLHAALAPLPAHGIGGDGVHPTVEMIAGKSASGDFTAAGLEYGYNVRNLLTIQMLDRLRSLR